MSQQNPEATIQPTPEAERTVLGGTLTCPVCGAVNALGEKWCVDCGFLLTESPGGPMPSPQEGVFAALRSLPADVLLPLLEGENPVGRLSGVVPLVSDNFASRQHAVIEVRPPEIWLRDLESTNGTFANGFRVGPDKRVRLFDGDQVRFAQSTFTVVAPEAGARPKDVTPTEAPVVAEVKIVGGPGEGTTFALTEGESIVGRQPDSGVLLSLDNYVSGRHCKLTVAAGAALLEDLSSRNGTFLNDQRVQAGQPVPLTPGDRIRTGATVIEFRFAAPSEGARGDNTAQEEHGND
jgi:pSer/pThr/pTyr-binding forkhead associated (FHA) protein